MKSLFKATSTKETKFNAFLQEKVSNLNAIRGGENPPPDEEEPGPISNPTTPGN